MSMHHLEKRQCERGLLDIRDCYRIGEVAKWLGVATHAVRYWADEFAHFLPARVGRSRSSHRVFTRKQALMLGVIRELLYVELYTIAGAKRQLRLAAERERQAG